MKSAREGFAPFGDDVWLNCAHQGPLPLVAAQAAESAIEWKKRPYELTAERFSETPALLRQAIGRLIHADDEDITLANSASYGLHLIARGIRWSVGDEVIVMEGDLPSDILPWLLLEARGVTVRRIHPRGYVFEPDELAVAMGSKTRLVCLTCVHSFSGWTIDLEAVGAVCKERGVTFVANGSQAVWLLSCLPRLPQATRGNSRQRDSRSGSRIGHIARRIDAPYSVWVQIAPPQSPTVTKPVEFRWVFSYIRFRDRWGVAGCHRPTRGFDNLDVIVSPLVASARRDTFVRQKNAALKSIEER